MDTNPAKSARGGPALLAEYSCATRTAPRWRPVPRPTRATGEQIALNGSGLGGSRGLQPEGVPVVRRWQDAAGAGGCQRHSRALGKPRRAGRNSIMLRVKDQGDLSSPGELPGIGGGPDEARPSGRERHVDRPGASFLMTMMLGVGLAAYSVVDTQQVETMHERQRESSFNLAEASLNSQSYVLSRRWAGAPVLPGDRSRPARTPWRPRTSARTRRRSPPRTPRPTTQAGPRGRRPCTTT